MTEEQFKDWIARLKDFESGMTMEGYDLGDVIKEMENALEEQALALQDETAELKRELGRVRQKFSHAIIDNPSLGLQPI